MIIQTAIATDYNGYSREKTGRVLSAISDAGFTHVHWSNEWQGDYFFTAEDRSKITALLREYHLQVKGIHASNGWHYQRVEGMYKWIPQAENRTDIASLEEPLRKKGSDLIRNRLELASEIGTREIVLHIQLPYTRFSDSAFRTAYYDSMYKTLDENESAALKYGVRACIENMVGTPNDYQFEKLDRLFERYSPDYLGYCCDTGHCRLTNPKDPFELPRRYRDRLYMIHLNDNQANPRHGDFSSDPEMSLCDQHLIMGEGDIDFTEFEQILAESPYEFPAVCEFEMHGEEESSFLNKCRSQTEQFTQKVLNIRNKE